MSDLYGALVGFMTAHSETIKPTLTTHVSDRHGYCSGCTYSRTRVKDCIFRQAAQGASKAPVTNRFVTLKG